MKVRRTKHTPATLGQALIRRGFRVIGEGAFSRVYAKPGSDRVIKVGSRVDFAYSCYLRKVLRYGQSCPWLPRIYAAHRYLSLPLIEGRGRRMATFTVAVLEKLDASEGLWNEFLDVYWPAIGPYGARVLQLPNPRVTRILSVLAAEGFGFDIHEGNVLFRGDQPVITDPIYTFRTDVQITRPRRANAAY